MPAGAARLVILVVGGVGIVLYLLPVFWNDRPIINDLTEITGIPFFG